jgi:predicted  nucleic acid-binding Zn-ribbon protein
LEAKVHQKNRHIDDLETDYTRIEKENDDLSCQVNALKIDFQKIKKENSKNLGTIHFYEQQLAEKETTNLTPSVELPKQTVSKSVASNSNGQTKRKCQVPGCNGKGNTKKPDSGHFL